MGGRLGFIAMNLRHDLVPVGRRRNIELGMGHEVVGHARALVGLGRSGPCVCCLTDWPAQASLAVGQ